MYTEGVECAVNEDGSFSCLPWNERQFAMVHSDDIDIRVDETGGALISDAHAWKHIVSSEYEGQDISDMPEEADFSFGVGDDLGQAVSCGVTGADGDVSTGPREIEADTLVCVPEGDDLPSDVSNIITPTH